MVFGMSHAHDARPWQGHGRRLPRRHPRHRAPCLRARCDGHVTHTAGVFMLGLVTLSLSQFILPETLFPGSTSQRRDGPGHRALRLPRPAAALARRPRAARDLEPDGHGHAHGGTATPTTARPRARRATATRTIRQPRGGGDAMATPTAGTGTPRPPRRPSVALVDRPRLSGGLLPCPSALVVLLWPSRCTGRLRHGPDRRVLLRPRRSCSGIGLTVYTRGACSGACLRPRPLRGGAAVASAAIITTLGAALTLRSLPGIL